MNWTEFLIAITGIYFFYYGTNLVYDLLLPTGVSRPEQEHQELVFNVETVPIDVGPKDAGQENQSRSVISSGTLSSTGAVNIKQLFALAQSDLIQYTKAIAY